MQEGAEQPDTVDSSRNQNSSKSGGNNKIVKTIKGNRKRPMGEDPKSKVSLMLWVIMSI